MDFPKQISLETKSRDPTSAKRQSDVQTTMADNLHSFAKEILKDLDDNFDIGSLKWNYYFLCNRRGTIMSEQVHKLSYKGTEILSYARLSNMETITYTPSISLGFLELLRQKDIRNLDKLLDSI